MRSSSVLLASEDSQICVRMRVLPVWARLNASIHFSQTVASAARRSKASDARSTALYGCRAPAPPGPTCRDGTAIGVLCTCASRAGASPECWTRRLKPWRAWASGRRGICQRFRDCAGASACSRSKRGNQNQEALGRSRAASRPKSTSAPTPKGDLL